MVIFFARFRCSHLNRDFELRAYSNLKIYQTHVNNLFFLGDHHEVLIAIVTEAPSGENNNIKHSAAHEALGKELCWPFLHCRSVKGSWETMQTNHWPILHARGLDMASFHHVASIAVCKAAH